jgi:hypothetical protein
MGLEKVVGAALFGLFLLTFPKEKKRSSPEIQKLFERFHSSIKLEENDERRKLRRKRELLISTLQKKMALHSLVFESFDQGSYALRTGVIPKDGNYDIDVGLIFSCSQERFPNPADLKILVHDALNEKNRTVTIRNACVTVTYMRSGRPEYHVDLALYVRNADGSLLLAKGRRYAHEDNCGWVQSSPHELTRFVLSKFAGDEQAQLRRCIRYLKRWRDEQFASGAPVSIALTVAAVMWFEPMLDENGKGLDLLALHKLVKKMQRNFGNNWQPGRLAVLLPGSRRVDLMSKLTSVQMGVFKERLHGLEKALSKCFGDVPLEEAAETLQTQFGQAFSTN